MATVANPQQDEDPNKPNAPTTGGTADVGETGGVGASGASAPGQTVSPVKQGSKALTNQGYTDVGAYLNANQPGAEKLGQTVAGNLTDKYNTTKSGIDTSYGGFNNQVNSGYTQGNEQLIKDVAANPTAAAGNAQQTADFQGQLNDTYTGPTSWGDFGTQQGNVNQAQQYGNLANTPGGYNVLAQGAEGPTASQGVNQLDSLLLGSNPNAAGAVQAASQPYNSLQDYLNSQNQAANNAIGGAQTEAANTSTNALNAFTGANGTLTNLNNTINTGTTTALNTANQQNADVNSAIASGTYSPQVLASLGMNQDQLNALLGAKANAGTSKYMTGRNYGVASQTGNLDIGSYLSQQDPTLAINAGNTATKDQYAQMAAIQQLLGSKNPQGNAINPALASLAGTAPTNFNQLDYAGATAGGNNYALAAQQQAQAEATAGANALDAQHAASKSHTLGQDFLNNIGKPLAKYFVNPLAAVKDEYGATQTGLKKVK